MKLCLKALRREHGLTQSAIAEALSCDQSLYSKYEREEWEIPLRLLIRLADYYHTSLDYLVSRTDNPHRETKS